MFSFIILALIFYYHCLADVMPYCVIGRCFMPGRCYLPFGMWQMLLPRGRCYPLIFYGLWQMLFAFWNVADVIAMRKMLSSYYLWLADVIAILIVEGVIPLCIKL